MRVLQELASSSGLAIPDVVRIVMSAPQRYKTYSIPKKSGGVRTIAQPSRELKVLQYVLLDKFLRKYPVHPAAMAYVRKRNIYDNAQYHIDANVVLKLDFEGFFPSVKSADWKKFVLKDKSKPFDDDDLDFVTRVLFWGCGTPDPKCLSIGAPTSPILSNILLFEFDSKIAKMAMKEKVGYTRYADDITISGVSSDQVLSFERVLRVEVERMASPKLKFNESKRGMYHKGERRMVTGLILTPVGGVSIGRERKRTISAMIHKFSLGEISIENLGLLKGLLGFTIANEPAFIERMRAKYGDSIIDSVLKSHTPARRSSARRS